MMDQYVQLIRNALCVTKDLNLFTKTTLLYDPIVWYITKYYKLPDRISSTFFIPLDQILMIELCIGIVQAYVVFTGVPSSIRMFRTNYQLLHRIQTILTYRGQYVTNYIEYMINVKLLMDAYQALKNMFIALNCFFISCSFFWLTCNSLHITETNRIGGIQALIHALTVMNICLVPLLYYMITDSFLYKQQSKNAKQMIKHIEEYDYDNNNNETTNTTDKNEMKEYLMTLFSGNMQQDNDNTRAQNEVMKFEMITSWVPYWNKTSTTTTQTENTSAAATTTTATASTVLQRGGIEHEHDTTTSSSGSKNGDDKNHIVSRTSSTSTTTDSNINKSEKEKDMELFANEMMIVQQLVQQYRIQLGTTTSTAAATTTTKDDTDKETEFFLSDLLEKKQNELEIQTYVTNFKSYREILYFVLNFIAWYGYGLCIAVYYLSPNDDDDDNTEETKTTSSTIYDSWFVKSILLLNFTNLADADYYGNLAGDCMWTIEPLIAILTTYYLNSMTNTSSSYKKKGKSLLSVTTSIKSKTE